MGLPVFPNFKKIELSDKEPFEKYSLEFEPVADFNFNNFYCWDTEGEHEISILNDNLVLKFSDYVTGKPFYSLLGETRIDDTIREIIEFADKKGSDTVLRLVTETVINSLERKGELIIEEDPDSFDYFFSIYNISTLEGRRYKNKRNAANACEARYNITLRQVEFEPNTKEDILNFLKKWETSKINSDKEVDLEYEYIAIERMLDISKEQDSVILSVAESNNEIVGFSIDELMPNKYVLSHYFKTLPEYTGLTERQNQLVATRLYELGYLHWNWQQDLGIENLQKMKLGYRPESIQKQYNVSLKDKPV